MSIAHSSIHCRCDSEIQSMDGDMCGYYCVDFIKSCWDAKHPLQIIKWLNEYKPWPDNNERTLILKLKSKIHPQTWKFVACTVRRRLRPWMSMKRSSIIELKSKGPVPYVERGSVGSSRGSERLTSITKKRSIFLESVGHLVHDGGLEHDLEGSFVSLL